MLSLKFTLRQLRYFIATGDAGSISRASENIHVSQPSISSAISQLENTFNLQLFIRHHAQGMTLTSAGKSFLKEAKDFLNHAEQLQGFAGELSQSVFGMLQVGCFIPLAPIITPDLCHQFMLKHTGVSISVREGHQTELLHFLRQGSIDLALTYDLELDSDIAFTPLARLEPYLLLSRSHRLAHKKQLQLNQLINENFILLDLPLSREYFMSLFKKQHLKPKIHARTRQTDVLRGLVAKGYGYSLANVRPINQSSLDGSELAYVPLAEPQPALTLGIAMLGTLRQTRSLSTFIEYCQEKIRDETIPGMTTL